MRLQTKIISGILPVILVSVFSLGFWISNMMSAQIREVYHSLLTANLKSYIHDELSRRYAILKKSNLDAIPSFSNSYQEEALTNVVNYVEPADENMLVFSAEGKLLKNTDSASLQTNALEEQMLPILVAAASSPDTYHQGIVSMTENSHIYTSTFFSPWNWTVVFLKSTKALDASIFHLYVATASAAGLCAISCALVVFLLLRTFFVKPVTSLHRATRLIAEGHNALPLDINSNDELGQLARGMEDMEEKLQRYSSEQKQLQEETKLSKDRLELIINGASLGTWEWNIGTGEVVFNERWAGMLGYRLDEIEHNVATWERIIHPEDAEDINRSLTDHFVGHTPYYMTEHRLRHKSGRWIWVLDVGKVFERDENGDPARAAGIHLDITEKKVEADLQAAKESAVAANKAKSVFLSNMSHELRTPLNAIMGYTQLLQNDRTLSVKQRTGINTIHQAGEHLLMLIRDILDLSKIEAGRLELAPNEIMLAPFLATIRDIIQVRSDAKSLVFDYEADADLPVAIVADGLRLRQVLFNLLSNAVKFTERGCCSLRVQSQYISPKEARLSFTVEDTGPGIPEKIQGKIFEPFQQFGERLKHSEGSGLGLTISRQLIELMKGELKLKSPVNRGNLQDKGAGSRFVFTAVFPVPGSNLPICNSDHDLSYEITGLNPGSKVILIVDDKSSNRAVLRDTLQPLGFVTCELDDGSRVIAACEKFKPDLILMDLRMPEVDGFAALDRIRNHEIFSSIPVIAVTASATGKMELRKRCIERGFKGFLTKPYVTLELLEIIGLQLGVRVRHFKNTAERPEPVVAPPHDLLERLRGHLQDGNIDALAGMAGELYDIDSGRYRVFARRLSDSVADMRLADIDKLLNKLSD